MKNKFDLYKLYTLREAAQILGMSYEALSQWSCKGFFDTIKFKGQKTLIKGKVVEEILKTIKYIQNSYSSTKAASIIGVSRSCFTQDIRKGLIKQCKKIHNTWYIPKHEVYFYAKNPVAYHLGLDINTKFYSSAQASEKLNISLCNFCDRAMAGYINSYLVKSVYYITEEELNRLKEEENFKKNSYRTFQVATMFGYGKDTRVDHILKSASPVEIRTICGIKYIQKEPIDLLYNKFKNFSAIEVRRNFFDLSRKRTNNRIQKLNIKDLIGQPLEMSKKTLFYRDIIEQIKKEEEESLTYEEARKLLNKSLSAIYSLVHKNKDIETFKSKLNGRTRILKSSLEPYIQKSNISSLSRKHKDPYEFLEECLKLMNSAKWQNTYNLCKEWSIWRLNNLAVSKRKTYSSTISRLIEKLLEYLSCELYDCTDEDVRLLSIALPISQIKQIPSLLDFCKLRYKDKCRFQISIRSPRREAVKYNSDISAAEKNEIYSHEEWIKYLLILEDTDRHIHKAFMSYRYASVWAYSLLHFSLTWRKSDMVRMPNIDLEEIDIFDFEWFYKGNSFTLAIAEKIVQQLIFKTRGMKPQKRGENGRTDLLFTIGKYQRLPLTIALIILEIHRRNQNKEKLFEMINNKVPNVADYDKLFDPEKLPSLKNRKCNKSLLTFGVEYANKSEGSKLLSYILGSGSRSHDLKKGQELPLMTRLYIQDTTNEGSINHIVNNQCRRGHFGVSFYLLLSISYDLKNWTMEEVTSVIEELNKHYTPMGVESVAEFLLYKRLEIETVFKELLSSPPENTRQLLESIIHGKKPSKLDYVSCIKGYKHCPFKQNSPEHCISCPFGVYRDYILFNVKDEVYKILELLQKTPEHRINESKKYCCLLNKLLYVLFEAKLEYEQYAPDYLKVFIDMDDLDKKLVSLSLLGQPLFQKSEESI